MIKYAVMKYVKPNIKTASAQIEVLCGLKKYPDVTYWKPSDSKREGWLLFDTEDEANKFKVDDCFIYGVQI